MCRRGSRSRLPRASWLDCLWPFNGKCWHVEEGYNVHEDLWCFSGRSPRITGIHHHPAHTAHPGVRTNISEGAFWKHRRSITSYNTLKRCHDLLAFLKFSPWGGSILTFLLPCTRYMPFKCRFGGNYAENIKKPLRWKWWITKSCVHLFIGCLHLRMWLDQIVFFNVQDCLFI